MLKNWREISENWREISTKMAGNSEKLAGYFENWREIGKNKRCQRFRKIFAKKVFHIFRNFKDQRLQLKKVLFKYDNE